MAGTVLPLGFCSEVVEVFELGGSFLAEAWPTSLRYPSLASEKSKLKMLLRMERLVLLSHSLKAITSCCYETTIKKDEEKSTNLVNCHLVCTCYR